MKPIYLDYMATTPIDPRVVEKMLPYLSNNEYYGNASSQHFYGYQAKTAIDNARAQVASLFNTEPKSIIWTSGATEANNLAIKGAACFYQRQGKHIITSKIEHKSVLDTCRYLETLGFSITYLTPKPDGLIDLDTLKREIRPDTILISIMHVNNEIGVIQDIASIGQIARDIGALFHVDAAQSAGKIPIDLTKLKIDLLSLSAHKVCGPKGIGAIYIRQYPKLHLTPQIHGGEQEQGLRSGTLPCHQIVGMGEAMQIASQEMTTETPRILHLRNKLWDGIKNIPNIQLNGPHTNHHRIANNLNISFKNTNNNNLILSLKNKLALSQASSCITNQPSYVLKTLNLPNNLISNTLRISIGRFTTEEEINLAIKYINEVS